MRHLAVVLALAALLLPPDTNAASRYDRAWHATGHSTLCFAGREWTRLNAQYDYDANAVRGLYLYDFDMIALAPDICHTLRHWRRADPWNVTGALLVVAHEWVHADQYAAGRPFAEREADRLGWQRIPYLRHALLRR